MSVAGARKSMSPQTSPKQTCMTSLPPPRINNDNLNWYLACRARDAKTNEQQKAQATRNRTADCPVRIRVSYPWGAPAPERCSADPVSPSRPQFHTIIGVTCASQWSKRSPNKPCNKPISPTDTQQANQQTIHRVINRSTRQACHTRQCARLGRHMLALEHAQ